MPRKPLPLSEQQCKSCRFWQYCQGSNPEEENDKVYGYCRRYPPERMESGENWHPVTHEDRWCGEWKENTNA